MYQIIRPTEQDITTIDSQTDIARRGYKSHFKHQRAHHIAIAKILICALLISHSFNIIHSVVNLANAILRRAACDAARHITQTAD